MWVGERQRRIMDVITSVGRIEAEAMALHLQVSRETIRRDLKELESSGRIRRVHGGAISVDLGLEAPFRRRRRMQVEAKRRIGRAAAALLRPGMSCFVDAGTTTAAFAAALNVPGLTIITNSIEVAALLRAGAADSEIFLLSGHLGADVPSTSGALTIAQIERSQVDVAILSPVGVHPTAGVTYYDADEAEIARTMIARAQSTILLADRTKLGQVSRYAVCACNALDALVTDAPSTLTELFRDTGVRRMVVAAGPSHHGAPQDTDSAS